MVSRRGVRTRWIQLELPFYREPPPEFHIEDESLVIAEAQSEQRFREIEQRIARVS